VNEDPKDALLKKYEDEITELRKLLAQYQNGEQPKGSTAQAAFAEKLNNSFKHHMKQEMIMNNADAVVADLVADESQP